MVDKDEVDKREEQLKALGSQLERVEQQLNWTTLELNKERARGDSMLQHQEVRGGSGGAEKLTKEEVCPSPSFPPGNCKLDWEMEGGMRSPFCLCAEKSR